MSRWQVLAVVLLMVCPVAPALADSGQGNLPVAVTITLEKARVLPGDIIEVTLSDFRDSAGKQPHARFRIIVQAAHGEILGGETHDYEGTLELVPLVPGDISQPLSKVFILGKGVIKFRYRAPLTCHPQGDTITVTNSLVLGDVLTTPLTNTEPLRDFAFKRVAMSCPDYVIVAYRETSHMVQSGQTWDLDQEVAVRIRLLPGKGAGIYRIGEVKMLAFKGKAEYRDRDERKAWTLAGAVPEVKASHLQIWYDRPQAKARRVTMPLVEVATQWRGPPGWPLKRSLAMGPVSQVDPAETKRRVRELRRQLGPNPDPDALPDMQIIMQRFMPLLEQITSHPDLMVTWGDGKRTMGGDGKYARSSRDVSETRAYSWRIFLHP